MQPEETFVIEDTEINKPSTPSPPSPPPLTSSLIEPTQSLNHTPKPISDLRESLASIQLFERHQWENVGYDDDQGVYVYIYI